MLGATYRGVGVLVAVNVENGQDVDVHLVQQAGHGCVAAVGGESLQGGDDAAYGHPAPCCRCLLQLFVCVFASLCHLSDEPLAEGGSDPLSGVDAAVHEDGRFGAALLLTKLKGQKNGTYSYS